MTPTCPKCHFKNPDNTVFCGKCRTKFASEEKIAVTETLEAPKEELTTGSTFAGRYQIIEELGKGDMRNIGLCGSIENLTLNIGDKHVNFSCYHHSTRSSLPFELD